jgi:hypothetical protein
MRYLMTATLKDGHSLEREFPDRDTAEAELRCIERLRRFHCGLPEIWWPVADGGGWCLSYRDFAEWPTLRPMQPAEAVAR